MIRAGARSLARSKSRREPRGSEPRDGGTKITKLPSESDKKITGKRVGVLASILAVVAIAIGVTVSQNSDSPTNRNDALPAPQTTQAQVFSANMPKRKGAGSRPRMRGRKEAGNSSNHSRRNSNRCTVRSCTKHGIQLLEYSSLYKNVGHILLCQAGFDICRA